MKKTVNTTLAMAVLAMGIASQSSLANDIDFTLGGGYPFLVIPEISLTTESGRWFGNYKAGLDDGYSLGYEKSLSESNKHLVGLVAGALGVRDDSRPCPQDSDDPFENMGTALGCALFEAFDEEVTNGLGFSYTYNFNGIVNSGWVVRLEFGYGEGADSKEKRTDGGVSLSYRF